MKYGKSIFFCYHNVFQMLSLETLKYAPCVLRVTPTILLLLFLLLLLANSILLCTGEIVKLDCGMFALLPVFAILDADTKACDGLGF